MSSCAARYRWIALYLYLWRQEEEDCPEQGVETNGLQRKKVSAWLGCVDGLDHLRHTFVWQTLCFA